MGAKGSALRLAAGTLGIELTTQKWDNTRDGLPSLAPSKRVVTSGWYPLTVHQTMLLYCALRAIRLADRTVDDHKTNRRGDGQL